MNIPPLNIRLALRSAPPVLDFVLPGLLPGSAGTIVGSGGVGKTTLLLQLAVALSSHARTAEGLCAYPMQPARVVFIAAEESCDILRIRLHAINEWLNRQQAQSPLLAPESGDGHRALLLERNLCLIPAAGHSVYLVRNGEPTTFYEDLCVFCQGARLIVIDPLRRLHDGDENSSAAMTQVVQVLESLGKRTGAAVVVAHHMNKGATFTGATDSASASRGSSALTDAVRWQLNLSGMSEAEAKTYGISGERGSYLRLDFAKANYMAPHLPIWMKRAAGGVLEPAAFKKAPSSRGSPPRKAQPAASSKGEVIYV